MDSQKGYAAARTTSCERPEAHQSTPFFWRGLGQPVIGSVSYVVGVLGGKCGFIAASSLAGLRESQKMERIHLARYVARSANR